MTYYTVIQKMSTVQLFTIQTSRYSPAVGVLRDPQSPSQPNIDRRVLVCLPRAVYGYTVVYWLVCVRKNLGKHIKICTMILCSYS